MTGKIRRWTICFILFSAAAAFVSAGELPVNPVADNPASSIQRELAREYRNITLGMSMEEVKELLAQDPWFNYRGEPDVSLLENPNSSLIDAGGSLFIKRGLFQFEENRLSAIVLELNPETVDWYTVYTTLEERYGTPLDMTPLRAWWEDGTTRLAMERPLTVKYLDLKVYGAFEKAKEHRRAWREKARQDFLSEF